MNDCFTKPKRGKPRFNATWRPADLRLQLQHLVDSLTRFHSSHVAVCGNAAQWKCNDDFDWEAKLLRNAFRELGEATSSTEHLVSALEYSEDDSWHAIQNDNNARLMATFIKNHFRLQQLLAPCDASQDWYLEKEIASAMLEETLVRDKVFKFMQSDIQPNPAGPWGQGPGSTTFDKSLPTASSAAVDTTSTEKRDLRKVEAEYQPCRRRRQERRHSTSWKELLASFRPRRQARTTGHHRGQRRERSQGECRPYCGTPHGNSRGNCL